MRSKVIIHFKKYEIKINIMGSNYDVKHKFYPLQVELDFVIPKTSGK